MLCKYIDIFEQPDIQNPFQFLGHNLHEKKTSSTEKLSLKYGETRFARSVFQTRIHNTKTGYGEMSISFPRIRL